MLHIITTLWRYENLDAIWESLKNYEDDYKRIVLSFNQSIATYL